MRLHQCKSGQLRSSWHVYHCLLLFHLDPLPFYLSSSCVFAVRAFLARASRSPFWVRNYTGTAHAASCDVRFTEPSCVVKQLQYSTLHTGPRSGSAFLRRVLLLWCVLSFLCVLLAVSSLLPAVVVFCLLSTFSRPLHLGLWFHCLFHGVCFTCKCVPSGLSSRY